MNAFTFSYSSSLMVRASDQQQHTQQQRPPPADGQLAKVLQRVQLGHILQRQADDRASLDQTEDWASILSLGEQQRLAFAR